MVVSETEGIVEANDELSPRVLRAVERAQDFDFVVDDFYLRRYLIVLSFARN